MDEGNVAFPRADRAHDVAGRNSATLSGVPRGFGFALSGYAFSVEGLVPSGVLMPCGAG